MMSGLRGDTPVQDNRIKDVLVYNMSGLWTRTSLYEDHLSGFEVGQSLVCESLLTRQM